MSKHQQIDTSKDLTKLSAEARRLIIAAETLGWLVRWANANQTIISLIPPAGAPGKPISIPTTNINHDRLRAWARQIARRTGLEKLEALDNEIRTHLFLEGRTVESVIEQAKERDRMSTPIPRPPKPVFQGVDEEDTLPFEEEESPPEEEESPPEGETPAATDDEIPYNPERKIVGIRPAGARLSRTHTYESDYAEEVTYDDGLVVFRCAEPGCGYTRAKLRSISTHAWQAHGVKRTPEPHQQGDVLSHGVTETKPAEGSELAKFLEKFIEAEVKRGLAQATEPLQRQIDSLTTELAACTEEKERYRSDIQAIHDMTGYLSE